MNTRIFKDLNTGWIRWIAYPISTVFFFVLVVTIVVHPDFPRKFDSQTEPP